ncbi:conserved unknown protein [Ectocarpus siliculosus]|uniref:Methyltransferase domain-containing protein n=1 Tax=Ectocarpus siliculosus TaxID=2880 RepID=D7FJW5_ECTSI|nr:conserved unknown protein [Ectocarpus siliculosus]|eukprot:CBJ29213.1 conserved unknown protein [Ectocarpus siliculosus]
MIDGGDSGSEGEEVLGVDWASLETNLSAETLESLRQHLQHQDGATVAAPSGAEERAAEAEPASAPDGSSSSGGGCTSPRKDAGSAALPSSNLVYKAKEYWDSRFSEEESYDWLASYADIAEYLHEAVPRDARILIVGCGNSGLSADMYDDGYRDMLSTDFSAVVIDKMRAKHLAARPGLRWEKMDMLALAAEDASFDAVVDKAAMDALMVDKGDPWNPDPATIEQSHRMCAEVSRVLVSGGVFVQLSFEQVHFRRKFLLGEHPAAAGHLGARRQGGEEGHSDDGEGGGPYGWDLQVHDIQREGGCFGQFLYLLRKR